MAPRMLTSRAVVKMRDLYVDCDVTGSVMRRADTNMMGAERNVDTTIPVAIWRRKHGRKNFSVLA